MGVWITSCCCMGSVPALLLAGDVFGLLSSPIKASSRLLPKLYSGARLRCGDICTSLQQEAL